MDVAHLPGECGQLGERQVMGRGDADGAELDQRAQQPLGADAPIVGIGALQQLVDQKQQRLAALGERYDLAQPGQLRGEA